MCSSRSRQRCVCRQYSSFNPARPLIGNSQTHCHPNPNKPFVPMHTPTKYGWRVVTFLLATLASALAADDAPTVISIDPPAGRVVQQVTYINIIFSENVTGVDATDLLINSAAPTNVVQNNPRDYTFQFAPVQVTGT